MPHGKLAIDVHFQPEQFNADGADRMEFMVKMLRQLSESTQILCVTHLPQVAGSGIITFRQQKYRRQRYTNANAGARY
ncbi:MAG: hypothetical protein GPOALKHO_000100 [Sodalis sp.]|nr:MAG: hypothetical protein GPOALKHO_000100 [Sodalis sp.]